jgi:membrane protease YdiL (CAAX protease family)
MEPTPHLDVPPHAPTAPTVAERIVALLEVLICSEYPTQFLLSATLLSLGLRPQGSDGTLNTAFVVTLSLVDTALLVGLILMFLAAHRDRPRDVFLGPHPVLGEVRRGIPLILAAFAIAAIVMLTLRLLLPSLHTVEHNPLQDLIRSPQSAALFAIVVVVAGGVREELQRAFLINRFERWLGGTSVGIVVTSAAFGVGHLVQGQDAAVATAALGAFWAVTYVRRRSVIAAVVSHAGFNLLQLAQLLALGR